MCLSSLQKGVTLSEAKAKLLAEGQRQAARGVTLTNSIMIAKTKNGALSANMKNKRKFKGNKK